MEKLEETFLEFANRVPFYGFSVLCADHPRIVVAFQPHRHSRTRDLFDDFTRAFNQADVLFVTDIYAAGEAPIPGISAEKLVQAIREHGHHDASYVADKNDLPEAMERVVRPGDVVIALGAGDVNACVRVLRQRLDAKNGGSTPVPGSVREGGA
jgi:UDP-N-acetylmuramate--alanine ligase